MDQIMTSLIDIIVRLVAAIPVVLTMVFAQTIKIIDKKRVAKDHYFAISVLTGLVLGAAWSTGLSASMDLFQIGRDALQNAIMATFIYAAKTAMKLKWPGDTGYGKKED